jgi:hypothetical protein
MSLNRRLVLAVAVVWLLLIEPYPVSLGGWALAPVLALLTLNVVLGVRTGWLAFARGGRLDEREAALRDRAFRLAFQLVALGLVTMLVTGYVSAVLQFLVAHQPSPSAIPNPFGARGIVALLELLAVAPTVVIALLQPGSPEQPSAGSGRRWLPLLAVPAMVLLWLTAVFALPARTALVHQVQGRLVMSGARCGDFAARRETALGFGGALRLEATVCWNGRQAFVVGDGALPWPSSLPAEEYAGLVAMDPSLTSCRPQGGDADFALVRESCTETIDQEGTMRYLLRGRVWPAAAAFGGGDQTIELVVTRDGRILSFG